MAQGGWPGETAEERSSRVREFMWWLVPRVKSAARAEEPVIGPGERVYVVYRGVLIGYAPLVRRTSFGGGVGLIRDGGAVAVTIDADASFAGDWKYRWWKREDERPLDLLDRFPELRELPAFVVAANRRVAVSGLA